MKPLRIVIFAKVPKPGFAKRRLIPALGRQGAAALAQRFLVQTLSVAFAAQRGSAGSVELCMTPAPSDPLWPIFAIPQGAHGSDQGEGDLGERLARAAQRVIEQGEAVLLIGTDCPELGVAELQQAAHVLQRVDDPVDATLFPTADGGYALLGLNRFHASLFEGIAWGTETVASETRRRFADLGWSVHPFPPLHDIDEPDDLKWLPKAWQKALGHK